MTKAMQIPHSLCGGCSRGFTAKEKRISAFLLRVPLCFFLPNCTTRIASFHNFCLPSLVSAFYAL